MFTKIPQFWLKRTWLSRLLWPISLVFLLLITVRRAWIKALINIIKPDQKTPVIVVGNHWIGGTGKTPIVIELAKHFRDRGYRVGIISRGYQKTNANQTVSPLVFPAIKQAIEQVKTMTSSDEVLLMAYQLCDANFVMADQNILQFPDHIIHFGVGAQRYQIYQQLTQAPYHCNLIISDDGLQHYQLPRHIELVVFDERGAGNGFVFPAGGLREPLSWMQSRIVLYRGQKPSSSAQAFYEIKRHSHRAYRLNEWGDWNTHESKRNYLPLSTWQNQTVHALAAIGNPQAFFDSLTPWKIKVIGTALADHALIEPEDFNSSPHDWFITEKDAVKCATWAAQTQHQSLARRIWVVPLETTLPNDFLEKLTQRISRIQTDTGKNIYG